MSHNQNPRMVRGNNNYCVYIHINKINNKKYIGITCKQNPEDRWGPNGSKYKKNQPCFYRAIQKYGWENFEHVIWAENLFEYEAKSIEVALIETYKTNISRWHDEAEGYNMTDGGEGTKGHETSEETRRKMSDALKGKYVGENASFYGKRHTEESKKKMSETKKKMYVGENHPFYGRKHTEDAKRKMSESKKGKYTGENNWFYGKKHSDETRAKMSENHADFKGGNHPKAKIVCQINNETNDIVNVFSASTDAERITGVNHSHIIACCRGKHKIIGGYNWKYLYDQTCEDNTILQGAISLGFITEEDALKMINCK